MAAAPDRLPWLKDEPAPKPARAGPAKAGGRLWPWYLVLLLLVAAVVAGAYWLLSHDEDAAAPELPAEQSLPIPVTDAVPSEATDAPPDAENSPLTAQPPSPQVTQSTAAPARPAVRRRSAPIATGEPQSTEAGVGRSIFPADDPVTAAPETNAAPVVAANTRPYSGRVVQLGAFPTRKQAEEVWTRITRRYPYLTTKPKMVNTVDVRGLGGGRPTRMYRLQLGTSSQAQSVVICQQLERAGHSCVVVY